MEQTRSDIDDVGRCEMVAMTIWFIDIKPPLRDLSIEIHSDLNRFEQRLRQGCHKKIGEASKNSRRESCSQTLVCDVNNRRSASPSRDSYRAQNYSRRCGQIDSSWQLTVCDVLVQHFARWPRCGKFHQNLLTSNPHDEMLQNEASYETNSHLCIRVVDLEDKDSQQDCTEC